MPMSQLEFLNGALDRVKHTPITIPTEKPELLRQYNLLARSWLTEAWWTFNTITESLVPLTVPDTTYLFGYSYVYAYPHTPEVLRVHDGQQPRAGYRLALLKQGKQLTKAVFTNLDTFTLIYGAYVDEQFWTPIFCNAFVSRLAIEAARLYTGSATLLADLKQEWLELRSEALRVDAFQQSPTRPHTNVDMWMGRWRGSLAHLDPFLVEAGE